MGDVAPRPGNASPLPTSSRAKAAGATRASSERGADFGSFQSRQLVSQHGRALNANFHCRVIPRCLCFLACHVCPISDVIIAPFSNSRSMDLSCRGEGRESLNEKEKGIRREIRTSAHNSSNAALLPQQ